MPDQKRRTRLDDEGFERHVTLAFLGLVAVVLAAACLVLYTVIGR